MMTRELKQSGWSRIWVTAAAVGLVASGLGAARIAAQAPAPAGRSAAAAAKPGAASVARGKYLVMAMGCHDCHTPWKMGPNGPEPEMTLGLSGHPAEMKLPPPPAPVGPWIASVTGSNTGWAGPWGISYTANLTPDPETGLGQWTEQQFVDTIRTGRRQGRGRELLPPMPWPAFKNLNDADLRSIFAYLRTVPAIKNKVPDPVIAPPAK